MQVGQAQVVRSPWYDRGVDTVIDGLTAFAVPHAKTLRLTYTVPANRVGIIDFINLTAIRMTAAAGVGRVGFHIEITPSGGAAQAVGYPHYNLNAVGDGINLSILKGHRLREGDKLDIYSEDGGVGGMNTIAPGYGITEYDA